MVGQGPKAKTDCILLLQCKNGARKVPSSDHHAQVMENNNYGSYKCKEHFLFIRNKMGIN